MAKKIIREFGYTVRLDKKGYWVARQNRKIICKDENWIRFYATIKQRSKETTAVNKPI